MDLKKRLELRKALNAYYMITEKSKDLFKKLVNEEKIKKHLNVLREYHSETYEHSLRVSLLSIHLGHIRNLNPEDIQHLGYAGFLHDIGKTKIAHDILTKKSELSTLEKEIIKEHPKLGYKELNNFDECIRHIVLDHHKYQIDNYPKEEPNKKVSHLTQIIAISDMYDALTNKRSYKDSFSLEKVKEIIFNQFKGKTKLYIIIF